MSVQMIGQPKCRQLLVMIFFKLSYCSIQLLSIFPEQLPSGIVCRFSLMNSATFSSLEQYTLACHLPPYYHEDLTKRERMYSFSN